MGSHTSLPVPKGVWQSWYGAYPCVKVQDGNTEPGEGLKSNIDEADRRIIPHKAQAAKDGYQRALVLANDTDVFVLLLHYMDEFENCATKSCGWNVEWGYRRDLYQYIPCITNFRKVLSIHC